MKNRYIQFLLALPFLFASCATQNMFTSKEKVMVDSAFQHQEKYQYTLKKNDKVSISVWDNDDLSVGSLYGIYNSNEVYGKWLMLDINGEVPAPKIGNINIENLTVPQAEEKLKAEYKKWVLNPIVEIKVLNKEVTILGELKTPGKYNLEKDENSLLEVIGKAGDFDFYANKKNIQIIRKVRGKTKTISVDLTSVNSYAVADINIIAGDIVYVPSRKGKHWDKRAGSTIVPIATVISSIVLVLGVIKK